MIAGGGTNPKFPCMWVETIIVSYFYERGKNIQFHFLKNNSKYRIFNVSKKSNLDQKFDEKKLVTAHTLIEKRLLKKG